MMNYLDSAAALLDGGWTPEDGEQLKQEYDLTDTELYHLISAMKHLEEFEEVAE